MRYIFRHVNDGSMRHTYFLCVEESTFLLHEIFTRLLTTEEVLPAIKLAMQGHFLHRANQRWEGVMINDDHQQNKASQFSWEALFRSGQVYTCSITPGLQQSAARLACCSAACGSYCHAIILNLVPESLPTLVKWCICFMFMSRIVRMGRNMYIRKFKTEDCVHMRYVFSLVSVSFKL